MSLSKTVKFPIKALLIDIGGTIHTQTPDAETSRTYAHWLWHFLRKNGITTTATPEALLEAVDAGAQVYKQTVEKTKRELPMADIWTDYYLQSFNIPKAKLEPLAAELSLMFDYKRKRVVPRVGLKEMITELDALGIRLGVISNMISVDFIPYVLNKYGIADYMETVIMSSECGIRKPAREIFDIALKEMNLTKDEVCYLGDTLSRDVLGVRNADWRYVIQIDYPLSYHRDSAPEFQTLKPDFFVHSLAEVVPLIKQMNGLI